MYLFINTSKDKNLDVFLIKEPDKLNQLSQSGDFKVSENLLKLIHKLLEKNNVAFRELKGIIVVTGPGPFTSLRIAVTIANTLSYSLKIPVVDVTNEEEYDNQKLIEIGLKIIHKQEVGKYIKPFYNKEPNIVI